MWAAVILSLTLGMVTARSPYGCVPCSGQACRLEPTGCLYGIVKDPCDRSMCASGPGGSCGSNGIYGRCGDGLSCNSCGRCTGCSKTRIAEGIRECFKDIHEC